MIQVADPRRGVLRHRNEILAAIEKVLDSGRYILGDEVARFEERFAAANEARHGIGVANGTDAIQLALRAVGVGPGDEVITVSHTAIATVAAIVAIGAVPVLIDIDPRTYTMDPRMLRGANGSRTKAILPVHLYGHPADMGPILEFAADHDLRVVEDCAQAHGATYGGRPVGSMGDAGCFSFYPTKNLAAIGDAGAVVTNRPEVADFLGLIRQYGWKDRNDSQIDGINSRLDEMQAAILNVRLNHLAGDVAARREIARRYRSVLKETTVEAPVELAEARHSFHLFVVRTLERDMLQQRLGARGVPTAIHYPRGAHQQRGFAPHVRIPQPLRQTEKACQEILSLPMHPWLSEGDIEEIENALAQSIEVRHG